MSHPELVPVVVCASGKWAATAKSDDHADELRGMLDDDAALWVTHCAPHHVEWWPGERVRAAQRKARRA